MFLYVSYTVPHDPWQVCASQHCGECFGAWESHVVSYDLRDSDVFHLVKQTSYTNEALMLTCLTTSFQTLEVFCLSYCDTEETWSRSIWRAEHVALNCSSCHDVLENSSWCGESIDTESCSAALTVRKASHSNWLCQSLLCRYKLQVTKFISHSGLCLMSNTCAKVQNNDCCVRCSWAMGCERMPCCSSPLSRIQNNQILQNSSLQMFKTLAKFQCSFLFTLSAHVMTRNECDGVAIYKQWKWPGTFSFGPFLL